LAELGKYREFLLEKTQRDEKEFDALLVKTSKSITMVREPGNLLRAVSKFSPDPKDAPYLAVGILIDAPIWSNDKALKKQNRIRVYNTAELLKELGL
jgi:predicted nucleic acid-binding protein